MKKSEKSIIIEGKNVKLTNLEKVYWPEEGYTKNDLIEYYRSVAKYILPYLKDRPESLHRFPNGIYGQRFYQKNVETHPEWVQTLPIHSGSTREITNYIICNDEATLIYLANLGCIEMNVWSSNIKFPKNPDYLVIDLDPEGVDFDTVIKVAEEVKKVLDSLEITGYIKTSGASGIHIFVPVNGKYNYELVKNFSKIIALMVHQQLPDITSLERMPEKRREKVYLDYLQNNYQATMASVYSVRPKPGATVSIPLEWDELISGLTPQKFTIKNALRRIEKKGDIFRPVLGQGIDIERVLKKIEQK